MKTPVYFLPIDVNLMIRLEKQLIDYPAMVSGASALLDRWEKEVLNPTMTPEDEPFRESYIRIYGAMFLFDCGRIYGIRQERARRKRGTTRQ